MQGELGDPGAAGVRGLDGEQVPLEPGRAAPASPSPVPVPEMEKDGRRLLILKKARRLKLAQRAVLELGFFFLPREHQGRWEQRVSQGPRVSRWVLGVMLGWCWAHPTPAGSPESTGGV